MYGCLTILLSTLWVWAVGLVPEKGGTYAVRQFDDVLSARAFRCRLSDYVCPTPVQFTVQLRNIEPAADPNVGCSARRFLLQRLSNARQIKLKNVEDHGYFRLTANVILDGCDIAAEMVDYGLMYPSVARAEVLRTAVLPPPKTVLPPADGYSENQLSDTVAADLSRGATVAQLLACQGDLSGIRSETTFQEALTIVSRAVQPRLPMLILWNDLRQNAFVDRDTPVGVQGFGTMRLDKALEIILKAVASSSVPLVSVDEGGILTIGTVYGISQKPSVRVYSVGDITAAWAEEDRSKHTGINGAEGR